MLHLWLHQLLIRQIGLVLDTNNHCWLLCLCLLLLLRLAGRGRGCGRANARCGVLQGLQLARATQTVAQEFILLRNAFLLLASSTQLLLQKIKQKSVCEREMEKERDGERGSERGTETGRG